MDTRARTVREKLVEIAQRQETISYSAVASIADLHVRSRTLFNILDDINRREHDAGRPLLTAVVVRKEEGTPGKGFFTFATRLGHHRVGKNQGRSLDRKLYWIRERDRVYAEWEALDFTAHASAP